MVFIGHSVLLLILTAGYNDVTSSPTTIDIRKWILTSFIPHLNGITSPQMWTSFPNGVLQVRGPPARSLTSNGPPFLHGKLRQLWPSSRETSRWQLPVDLLFHSTNTSRELFVLFLVGHIVPQLLVRLDVVGVLQLGFHLPPWGVSLLRLSVSRLVEGSCQQSTAWWMLQTCWHLQRWTCSQRRCRRSQWGSHPPSLCCLHIHDLPVCVCVCVCVCMVSMYQ